MKKKLLLVITGGVFLLSGIFLCQVSSSQALFVSPIVEEYTVDPGETISIDIFLKSDAVKTVTYYPVFQDFTANPDESGAPIFLEEGVLAEVGSLAKWMINFTPITLEPGQEHWMTALIRIPENAEPGGHYGGILFQDQDPEVTGNAIGLSYKVGPIFLVNVRGDVSEELEILDFRSLPEEKLIWNRPPVEYMLRIKNSGTVHQAPQGDITLKGWFPRTIEFEMNTSDRKQHVLPNSIRKFDAKWEGKSIINENGFLVELKNEWNNFAFGPYKATANLTFGLNGDQAVSAQSNTIWLFPWRVILVILFVLTVIVALLRLYNKTIVKLANKKK